ncbi:MAG: hypothetical protein QOD75_2535 [Blastocatellia bacterium]|nr:hypothetical protein [Blastocatellia bacterium]
MIVRVERDVTLREKGAAEFRRILQGEFHGGDTLQVGAQAKAWVECADHTVCPHGPGTYTQCCRDVCDGGIAIAPPKDSETQSRIAFIRKSELPPGELKTLEVQEAKIRRLGADQVTTQFLITDLYSSWKLVEAKDELKGLTKKLDSAEAKQDLKTLYLPMLRRTGDMQLKVGVKEAAEKTYLKAVDLAPQTASPREKADAHVTLGQFYEKTGQKDKAVANLEKGEQLYRIQGDTTKATAARETIQKIQKQ